MNQSGSRLPPLHSLVSLFVASFFLSLVVCGTFLLRNMAPFCHELSSSTGVAGDTQKKFVWWFFYVSETYFTFHYRFHV